MKHRVTEVIGVAFPAVKRGRLMHTVTQITFKFGVMWRRMGIGAVAFGLAIGHDQVHRAPRDLIVAAVFMTLEAHIHVIGFLGQRFFILIAQVGNCIADLMVQIIEMPPL